MPFKACLFFKAKNNVGGIGLDLLSLGFSIAKLAIGGVWIQLKSLLGYS